MPNRTLLGVNIDHVATIRNARGGTQPDPIHAATLCEFAGADGITVHLREDRRHIIDRDVRLLKQCVATRLNLEMGLAEDIQALALEIVPSSVTLVPEKREELTTEGGLDVMREFKRIKPFAEACMAKGIVVSLFIDPERDQIQAAHDLGVQAVEIHTGAYANAFRDEMQCALELERLADACDIVHDRSLRLLVGHGLDYHNVEPLMDMELEIEEANIGHAIVARAVMVGLEQAVSEMRELLFW